MISEPHDEKNITTSIATPVTIADMLDCAFHEGTLHPLKDSDGEDGDEEEEEEEEKWEDIGELSTQELFTKMRANDRSGPSIGSIRVHPSTRVEKSDGGI
ncbi:hypothetical protein C4D60_Mb01t26540 [Musa balbisiana]|uniref:Uncharacterized protein n=1 Tax=Musa balbisiana TaxID=52838 RepID=A0A4S8JQX4_MUSBA|nr:hypothetical protein C4D60_Mb01t26540 [Musa balbisiana]